MATLTAPAFYGEAAKPKQRLSFVIAASSCGTLIEWYDFYLYGVLAGFFGTHFFPGDMKQGFLYSLGIFWTGFVVRPFGAVIFGHLGDLIGRKYTFMLTLGLMGLATFLVGCLPTYDSDRLARACASGGVPCRAGPRARRRIWRRGNLCCRARAGREPRLLHKLDPDHRDHGHRHGASRHPRFPRRARRSGVQRLWLALSVPALRRAGDPVGLHPAEARRIAFVRAPQGTGQDIGQSGARHLHQRPQLGPHAARALRLHRARRRRLVHQPVLRFGLYADRADDSLCHRLCGDGIRAAPRCAVLHLLGLALRIASAGAGS